METVKLDLSKEDESGTNEYPNRYAHIPPNRKVCPFTGLKHGHLYKLLGPGGRARDFVRVVTLKEPRARHGKTLFHLGDMLLFLDSIAEEQGTGSKRPRPVNSK